MRYFELYKKPGASPPDPLELRRTTESWCRWETPGGCGPRSPIRDGKGAARR